MMKTFQILENNEWLERLRARSPAQTPLLYAMYSSLTGGITTDPTLMSIPADDHLPQRGDGVFESLKCLDGQLYNAGAHWARLEKSCRGIGLDTPIPPQELLEVICATIRAGAERNCLVRVLVSRGTGNMGIDPALCDGPVLYVVAYRYSSRTENETPLPACVGLSKIPVKPKNLATIKACNYLPNVLMKREAGERGLDFVISLDPNGNLAEGATENIGILTAENELLLPGTDYILAGTTARRALELAQTLVESGELQKADHGDITPEMAAEAKEIFIFGTTTDVTPVVEWEGQPVGNGSPGPMAQKLLQLLKADMTPDSQTLTNVF